MVLSEKWDYRIFSLFQTYCEHNAIVINEQQPPRLKWVQQQMVSNLLTAAPSSFCCPLLCQASSNPGEPAQAWCSGKCCRGNEPGANPPPPRWGLGFSKCPHSPFSGRTILPCVPQSTCKSSSRIHPQPPEQDPLTHTPHISFSSFTVSHLTYFLSFLGSLPKYITPSRVCFEGNVY